MAAEEMIGELFSSAFGFDDVEAVANENAESMNAAFVRPAFFDVSSVMYRFLYAKADEYCRMAGDSDTLLVCYVCCDIISDISDACSTLGCAPILCFDSVHSFRKDIIFPEYKKRSPEFFKNGKDRTGVVAKRQCCNHVAHIFLSNHEVAVLLFVGLRERRHHCLVC